MPGDILDLLFQVNVDSEREFRLMPLDKIEVKFPDLSELNQEQRILPDGNISLPYLGAIKVVGYTPDDLQIELRKRYARVLKNPNLFVVVKEYGAKIQELKESIRTSARGQSKLITVRSDGYATFPIIGEVEVFNKTIPEITEILNRRFNTVTEDIKIDLLLHESQGARICVVGAVSRPGCYPIRRPLTLLEAVALAGGFRDDADSGTVVAMRKDGDKMVHRAVNLTDVLAGSPKASHWYLSTNDIVYVSRSRLSEAAKTARHIADIIFFRGWSIGFDRNLSR
jgi:polysaccharide export outer membrane protein